MKICWRRYSLIRSYMLCGMRMRIPLLLLLLLAVPLPRVHAQSRDSALSDSEVEKLRDLAPEYAERVLAFDEFLDQRARRIVALTAGRRHAGREEDLHEMMEQFTSITEDLEDNLEDYGPHHRDLRKVLPKLLAATDRWLTALKTPPDDEAYNVSRKLALESVNDLREDVTKLIDEQKTWFLAHPPAKEQERAKEPR